MTNFMISPWRLKKLGVVGINRRNLDFVAPHNEQRYFTFVDDKIKTKLLLAEHGLPTPELYGIISTPSHLKNIPAITAQHPCFVMKPSKGRRGKGILVIDSCEGDTLTTSSGRVITQKDLYYRASNIVNGIYSIDGNRDSAHFEYKISQHHFFDNLAINGVADIRVIVLNGTPLMAMMRLPTSESDGKANLHQGGIGVGVDIHTGRTTFAIHKGKPTEHHSDTNCLLAGHNIPFWKDIIDISVQFQKLSKLGYVGVDIVLDEQKGVMILEGNARPGLAAQLANRRGLLAQA